MKFEEALAAMREGKKVRYIGANEYWFLHIDGCRIVNQEGNEFPLSSTSMVNYDWEIYEEPKWEPEGGEWYVNIMGSVTRQCELRKEIIDFGIVRQTREQTEKARDKMRVFNRLLAYVDEHAPDYDPNWGDSSEEKWFVFYDHHARQWDTDNSALFERRSCIYMPKEVAEKLVDDLNSGRVEL